MAITRCKRIMKSVVQPINCLGIMRDAEKRLGNKHDEHAKIATVANDKKPPAAAAATTTTTKAIPR